jgi:uncharacterized protein YegP (UPF0339 family)
MYVIENYSTKSLFQRRQYRWRTRHANGNIIAQSSEGYNNKADRDQAVKGLIYAIQNRDYKTVTV